MKINYYYSRVFDQTQASQPIKKTNYLYNGKELQHNEFGAGNGLELCDFDKRAYDSQTGRFNQTDILADQRNNLSPYNYCSNNPINRTDPTGMIDGWYNNENNQSTFDKNINSQADMTKAGINGTFIGQEALVVDNKDNTMKWGNKDGTLGGINLPEVAVSSGSGNDNTGEGHQTANDVSFVLGFSAFLENAATSGFNSVPKYAYRGMAQAESFAANTLQGISKVAKGLGAAGSVIGIGAAGYQLYNRQTAGNATRLAVQGVAVGAAFIPVVGWGVSLGIGVADYTWGDDFYNWIDKR